MVREVMRSIMHHPTPQWMGQLEEILVARNPVELEEMLTVSSNKSIWLSLGMSSLQVSESRWCWLWNAWLFCFSISFSLRFQSSCTVLRPLAIVQHENVLLIRSQIQREL